MNKTLEFYFDFASPTAYLAHVRLQQLQAQYGLEVIYRPGGVFKATGNTSPITIPAKGAYMNQYDLPRFAKRYGAPLEFNPHFSINSLNLMRGAITCQQLGCFDAYVNTVYRAMWGNSKNMGALEIVAEALSADGLDATAILELSQQPDIKAALISGTEEAVERGAFGALTLFMDGQMDFGQDRLDFIEEALQAS